MKFVAAHADAILRIRSQGLDWIWRAWRIVWLLTAAGVLAYGASLRLSLPAWPWMGADSILYLAPSVNGGVYNIGPRTFVYPLFCRLTTHGGENLPGLVVAQRWLGLIGPASILLAWYFLGKRIWRSRFARAGHEFLGLGLLLLLVPSTGYIFYEQQALAECFSAFLQCLLCALLCLLWLPASPVKRTLLASGTAALGIFMYFANPRWGAAAPMVIAVSLSAVLVTQNAIRSRLAAACCVLAAVVLSYVGLEAIETSLVPRDPWNDTFIASTLLWSHADLTVNEFRRDLATPIPPKNAELLRAMVRGVDKEIVGIGKSHWITLSYNPNALLYVPGCPNDLLQRAFYHDPRGFTRFCLRYFFRILRHQPIGYAGQVRRMLAEYYAGPVVDGVYREQVADVFGWFESSAALTRYLAEEHTLPELRSKLEAQAAEMQRHSGAHRVYRPADWLVETVNLAHSSFLFATLAGVGCALWALVSTRLRAFHGINTLAWICLASILVLFAQELTISLVTMSEGRYADALRTLGAFSQICSLAMIGSLAAEYGISWARFRQATHLMQSFGDLLRQSFQRFLRFAVVLTTVAAAGCRKIFSLRGQLRRFFRLASRLAIVLAALAVAGWLGGLFYAEFHKPPEAVVAGGVGSPSAPYSDALGPWLDGSMSYYMHGAPLNYLYRPTVGLFYSTIISATSCVAAVPAVWLILFLAAFAALFAVIDWPHRTALVGIMGTFVIFFDPLIRLLNPASLMADLWPACTALVGIWMIALGETGERRSTAISVAGFLLLGISACVRGPQLASSAALLALVAPARLRRRAWLPLALMALACAGPYLADSAIQKRNGVVNQSALILYSFYTDPNHSWSMDTDHRFVLENPAPSQVRSRYLGFLLSLEGAKIVCSGCGTVINHAMGLATDRTFFQALIALAFAGWLATQGQGPPPAEVWRRWTKWLTFAVTMLAAYIVLYCDSESQPIYFVFLLAALTLNALVTRRRFTAMLMIAFGAALLLHAALGLAGGSRVSSSYELLLLAGLVSAVTERPDTAPARPRWLGSVAWAAFVLVFVGYTGNFWIRTGAKARMRAALSVPQTAMKISDDPQLDRSLYLMGQGGVFYTRHDPFPFGAVRGYGRMDTPEGIGCATFVHPLHPEWRASAP